MGMSLYEMFENDTPVVLRIGKGIINFRYDSAALSAAALAEVAALEGLKSDPDAPKEGSFKVAAALLLKIAGLIAGIVTWWDVLGRDHQPVPLTKDAVAELPVRFLMLMMDKITELQAGEELPGKTMNGDSDSTLSPQAVRNGSATSPNGIRGSSPAIGSMYQRGIFSPNGSPERNNGQRRPWSQNQQRTAPRPGPR